MQIEIDIPEEIASSLELGSELKQYLIDKALTKMLYFQSRANGYTQKYGQTFEAFKQQTESLPEDFSRCDDLIVWEGYHLAAKEWERRYSTCPREPNTRSPTP